MCLSIFFSGFAVAVGCDQGGCISARAVNELGAPLAQSETQLILPGKTAPQKGKPEVRIKLIKKDSGGRAEFGPEELSPYIGDGQTYTAIVNVDGYVEWKTEAVYRAGKPNNLESKNPFTLRIRPEPGKDAPTAGFTLTVEKFKAVADGSEFDGDKSRNGELYLAMSPSAVAKSKARITVKSESGTVLYKGTVTLSSRIQAFLRPAAGKPAVTKSIKQVTPR